jgi:hypothetical protein
MQMKYIKEYNDYNLSGIQSYLIDSTFDLLPFEYKRSLIIWLYEGDIVDWSFYEKIDWINDIDKVNILINDYSKTHGNKKFVYGIIPSDLLKNEVVKRLINIGDIPDNVSSWDDYQKWYNDKTNHNNSIFPIIINDESDELIVDGWHRFHSYIKKGFKDIPVVGFIN